MILTAKKFHFVVFSVILSFNYDFLSYFLLKMINYSFFTVKRCELLKIMYSFR